MEETLRTHDPVKSGKARRMVIAGAAVVLLVAGVVLANALIKSPRSYEVTVFLSDAAKEPRVQQVLRRLMSIEGVRDVEHISKDDAYEEFKELYKDQPALRENITADTLPSSIRLDASGIDSVRRARAALRDNEAIEDFNWHPAPPDE